MKIAVLDENIAVGEMLQQGLQLAGHSVDVYSSPSKFLTDILKSTTASTPVDLIIVELLLSEGISGVEVIHQVRNTFPDLPVILISSGSSWQIETARKALPGIGVLRKPFRLTTLMTMVKKLSK